MQFLGGHHWKAVGKVEPHLTAKHSACARAGPISAFMAIVQNVLQEIEILLHVGLGRESIFRVQDTTETGCGGKARQRVLTRWSRLNQGKCCLSPPHQF
jgi:hypothetical protein